MKPSIIALVLSVASITTARAQERPNWAPDWTPVQGQHAAEMIGPLEYLPTKRDWERLTVWIPKDAPTEGRLPCIIHVYGGGYMNKGCPSTPGEEWLERGFVVAQPDYMLRASGTGIAAGWDILHAIRYLRANAERFRIDPERIGILGISAGGWIAQRVCYADDRVESAVSVDGRVINKVSLVFADRELPDTPARVQAVVSDWGASKLATKEPSGKGQRGGSAPLLGDFGQVTADDPPLMTCFHGDPRDMNGTASSIGTLASLGIPAEPVFLGTIKSTHAPKGDSPGRLLDGRDTTWDEAVGDYFERHVENPTRATAPELHPHGGRIAGPTDVQVLSVHGPGSVRFTLDGSEPTSSSAVAGETIRVAVGQTLKVIAVRDGLAPSRIAVASFVQGNEAPVVTTAQRSFELKAGQAFSTILTATASGPVAWSLIGQTLVQTGNHFKDLDPWITIDSRSGGISAPQPRPGNYTVYAIVGPPLDGTDATADSPSTAIRLHFSVTE